MARNAPVAVARRIPSLEELLIERVMMEGDEVMIAEVHRAETTQQVGPEELRQHDPLVLLVAR